MTKIVIYQKPSCPFCIRAINLLQSLNANIDESINLLEEPHRKAEMIERSGRKTVPQIFIDGKHIGGCDDLFALHEKGLLEKMLQNK